MSVLNQVRDALTANPKVSVVDETLEPFAPERATGISESFDIYVVPVLGANVSFDAKSLQAFMLSMIPGITPTSVDDFADEGKMLKFGKLYFDEVIGQVKSQQVITITDPDLLRTQPPEKVIIKTHDIIRRTRVRLYPYWSAAERALRGVDEFATVKATLE